MKKSQKVLLVVVCIGLIFACIMILTKEPKTVTVAWDAPTSFGNGTPISRIWSLRYNVYIDCDTDNTHDDKILLTREPIPETEYSIHSAEIEQEGIFFVGVQALAFREFTGQRYGDPVISTIAWSSNDADTQSGAFSIEIK